MAIVHLAVKTMSRVDLRHMFVWREKHGNAQAGVDTEQLPYRDQAAGGFEVQVGHEYRLGGRKGSLDSREVTRVGEGPVTGTRCGQLQ